MLSDATMLHVVSAALGKPASELTAQVVTVVGSDPAAGQEASVTVPAGDVWVPIILLFELITDATTATRLMTTMISDAQGRVITRIAYPGGGRPANQINRLSLYGAAINIDTGAYGMSMPLPLGLVLLPGYSVKTVTPNLQAGDNYSAPVFTVVRWR